jgi:hypothetical protein
VRTAAKFEGYGREKAKASGDDPEAFAQEGGERRLKGYQKASRSPLLA